MKSTSLRRHIRPILSVAVVCGLVQTDECRGSELHVGASTVSITPDRPVALSGQMHTRISQSVRSPVKASALALESRDGTRVLDQAILIACDLVSIDRAVIDRVRGRLKERLPDFDVRKLVLSATHTHTAPVLEEGKYLIPRDGVMPPAEYAEFVSDRIVVAAAQAWNERKPGRAGWGLGHAVIAQNRRAVYADGQAVMYGATGRADFRGIEGPEDHGIEVLCFWDHAGKLIATAINVACPSQEVEGASSIDADFWHETRDSLKAKQGNDLSILAWTGAAGDQSPHLMYRKQAEERMRTIRNLTRLEELARRIVAAWDEAYDAARRDQNAGVTLVHRVETIDLPVRLVTDDEAARARAEILALSRDQAQQRRLNWHQDVIDRYERQKAAKVEPYRMELHVVRVGDIVIATNDFELFTQYGIQIKSRSRALQTFIIQLAGHGTYLPTAEAVKGGGYSAIVASSVVGPEGGRVLVERTVELINSLWPGK